MLPVRFAHFLYRRLRMPGLEQCGAGHKNIRACLGAVKRIFSTDSAVNLNVDLTSLLDGVAAQVAHLVERFRNQGLPTEARAPLS